jgi:hypothetical protein
VITIASYGGGTNSTAMLIECAKRGVKVDLILFADTGGEKPHTYNYVQIFSDWLVANGMPEIITVKKVRANGEVLTLEQNCLEKNMLPSIAYGFKSCSQKYKIAPMDIYVNNWPPAKEAWAAGEQITKLIGYDTDEAHRSMKNHDDNKYKYEHPLIEWNMGREDCIASIQDAGLCLPGKSACYFCPNSKPSEIRQLATVYPELAERALAMESGANLTHIKGLGRNYAWKDILATSEMFSDEFHITPEMACECYDG